MLQVLELAILLQKDYSIRIRDDRLVEKLLTVEEDKIEVKNMNKLFGI